MSNRVDLLVLIGPSGAGKSSLARELHRRRVIEIRPTWTTRPRRPDEHGRAACPEHRFVSDRDFDELSAHGFFAASGTQPGLPHRYGLPAPTPRTSRGLPTVILRARHVAAVAAGRAALVYQVAADDARLASRLTRRGTEPRELSARLAAAEHELAEGIRVCDRSFTADRPVDALADAIVAALLLDRSTSTLEVPDDRAPTTHRLRSVAF